MLKDELLAAAFGADAVAGAVANFSGEMLGSGAVVFTRNVDLRAGELHGAVTPRIRRIVGEIDAAGVRATASDAILVDEWSKFAAWAGLMTLSVTTRRNTCDFLCDPAAALVLVQVVREVGRLAAAVNVELAGAPVLPVQSRPVPSRRSVRTRRRLRQERSRDDRSRPSQATGGANDVTSVRARCSCRLRNQGRGW